MANASRWKQIGGDVDPKEHGAILARLYPARNPRQVEIVEIDPDVEGVSGYWVQRADIFIDDLEWEHNKDVARSSGISQREWAAMSPEERAERRLSHWGASHLGGDAFQTKLWSKALPAPSRSILWWR